MQTLNTINFQIYAELYYKKTKTVYTEIVFR